MKIKGSGNYVDATGAAHEVKGMGIILDDTALQSLKVSGKLEFEKISCDDLNVSGKCVGGSISAKTFSFKGKIEVDTITAQEGIINSRSGSIEMIKCSKLKIFNNANEDAMAFITRIFGEPNAKGDNNSRLTIKEIDSEKIELENCQVEAVHCHDIQIGKNCLIAKLLVAGECIVDEDSTIGEIIRE
ncbi:MAG: hypothetical protein SR1Q5_10480 [Quinella sp. 1Q5]|nr:hypothetical protein [Quinella sp. 1Q5]